MKQPLLSIVIANYNYGRFLGEAIESVVTQINDAGEGMVELIICDAVSTDNSVEVIKRYEKYITWWCSEKDRGQSNAFNKGFSHAKGKFLTWLNADDVMFPGVVKALKTASEKDPDQEWFVGGMFYLDPEMRVVSCGRGRPFSRLRFNCGNICVWGPSSFFTKRLLDEVDGVDERFHYTMDTELWAKFYFKANKVYKPFIDYAWGLRRHPESKMTGQHFVESAQHDKNHPRWKQLKKEKEILKSEFRFEKNSKLKYLMSISFRQVAMAYFDMLRYRGKRYNYCFKDIFNKRQ